MEEGGVDSEEAAVFGDLAVGAGGVRCPSSAEAAAGVWPGCRKGEEGEGPEAVAADGEDEGRDTPER